MQHTFFMATANRFFTALLLVLLLLSLAPGTPAHAQENKLARASELLKNRQYQDAIKLLNDAVRGQPDAGTAVEHLLLGECYFLTQQYDLARPAFVKAAQNGRDEKTKAAAEYRLATVAFRLKDFPGASAKIKAFAAQHPDDARVGKLLAYQMMILAAKGRESEGEIERLHRQIYDNIQKYNFSTGMEADDILCDFYRQTGQAEKAQSAYTRIVQNFRRVITDYEKEKRPIPAALEKSHDNAALQLGILALDRKQTADAVKWLENVRYDLESKQKARLFLAKTAYEKQDFGKAIDYLNKEGFIDTVPASPLKSDMYLLLGLAERSRANPNASRVEEWLKRVGPEAKGFAQAQSALGDLYRDKGLTDEAIKAFSQAQAVPDHAPNALFNLGAIYFEQAGRTSDTAKAGDLFKKSGDLLGQLLTKYPLAPQAKLAKDMAAQLTARGIAVGSSASGDELAKAWEKAARDQPGTSEGAQALLSLIRFHAKKTLDEKTGDYVKAPNYVASAAACDKLLDAKVYSGKGLAEANWRTLKAEALFHRGDAELASVAPSREGKVQPVFLKTATADRAIEFLKQARELVDPKQLEMLKGIELGLVEAMFKSDKKEHRAAGEQRFGELENDYGNDPRFQKLALDLAEWYRQQGRLAEAGKQYLGVAHRGKDLAEKELLKILYTAGSLFSKAGAEAQKTAGETGYGLYIFPKEAIQLGDDLLKTHAPFRRLVEPRWPRDGQNLTAAEALVALSQASGIPFIWFTYEMSNKGRFTGVGNYLSKTRVNLREGKTTVDEALKQILDLNQFRLAFDIGITDGKPTITPPASEDPDAEKPRVIEIYEASLGENRFPPLERRLDLASREGKKSRAAAPMLFNILQRLEEVTQTRVVWADGIDKQEKLAAELKAGLAPNVTCGAALTAALEPLNLRFRVIKRDLAAEQYEAAKDAFNQVRQIDPKSKYGERALFAVALNYYNQQDHEKMKVVLREYLKVFDSPANEFYHQASFWIGWAFEREKKYREAVSYYARGAEERLVVAKADTKPDAKPATRDALKQQLSYDSQFALLEPLNGAFKEMKFDDFLEFIRQNTHVEVRLDPAVTAPTNTLNRAAFKGVPGFTLLCDTLEPLGLTFRVENVNAETAERAYFRLASAYKKDNLMEQALENCRALLTRYPSTTRRRETQSLMLEVYKGLKDYRNVMATLEELKRTATDDAEKRRLDAEIASILFDMADYAKAAQAFKDSLQSAKETEDRLSLRDGYARALFRDGKSAEALAQYELLAKEETNPLRQFVAGLMVFGLKFTLDQAFEREFPEAALRYVQRYEALSETERNRLTAPEFVRATWIYYVQALIDFKKDRTTAGLEKLKAVATSPDDFLAGDANYRIGLAHLAAKDFEKARESFEYLLFATKSSESVVRATYQLGVCLHGLGRTDAARQRFQQILDRYPLSPFVELVKKNPVASGASKTATSPARPKE